MIAITAAQVANLITAAQTVAATETTSVYMPAEVVDVVVGRPAYGSVYRAGELADIIDAQELAMIELANPVAAAGMDITWIMVVNADWTAGDLNPVASVLAGKAVYGDAMAVPAATLAWA